MAGPHLIPGYARTTTDSTLRRDLEASLHAASHAELEARLCAVELKLERLVAMLHTLTDALAAPGLRQYTEEP